MKEPIQIPAPNCFDQLHLTRINQKLRVRDKGNCHIRPYTISRESREIKVKKAELEIRKISNEAVP